MLKIQRSGTEKAPGSLTQGNTEGQGSVSTPNGFYPQSGQKVKRALNWPENGLEFLFIYPVDSTTEALKHYRRMLKDVRKGILVMIFQTDGSAIAIDLQTKKWKSYNGRPSERELTKLQKGSLNNCHPRHDPEGYFKAMREHSLDV